MGEREKRGHHQGGECRDEPLPKSNRELLVFIVKQVGKLADAVGCVADLVTAVGRQGECIMGAVQDLKDAVAASRTVQGSAIVLLEGLSAKLDEAIASGDIAEVAVVNDEIKADTATLAAAVEKNTRPQPTPAP